MFFFNFNKILSSKLSKRDDSFQGILESSQGLLNQSDNHILLYCSVQVSICVGNTLDSVGLYHKKVLS